MSDEDDPGKDPHPNQLPTRIDGNDISHTPVSHTEALWAQAVAERRQELVNAGVHKIKGIHDFEAVQSGIEAISSRRRRTRAARVLKTLDGVIERLKKFVLAISVFVQSDPTYSSLIWGGLLVCLECCSQSNRALKAIEDHFERMASAMPRFEQYTRLYSTHERLGDPLLRIYGHYLDACIHAVKFLHQKSWWRPMTSVLSPVVQRLEDSCRSIEESATEFEREATFADREESAVHRKDSETRWKNFERHQSRVEEALPSTLRHPVLKASLFSVPFQRNQQFLGREEEFKKLNTILADEMQTQTSCAISGIGGVGKTNFALEVCYRFKHRFPFIFWIAAENEAALSTSFANLAAELNIPDAGQGPSSVATDAMRRWLCEHSGWLLVFDNADSDQSALNKFWPPCDHGSILVTSQNSDWIERTPFFIQLGPLDEDLGSQLLLHTYHSYSGVPDMELARNISKEVDGLPLLLVGLGGSLSQNHLSLEETLETIQNSPSPLQGILSDRVPCQYERPIQLVFQLSFSRLPVTARQVISVMAMLSSDNISESLIMAKPRQNDYGDSLNLLWFATNVRQNLCSRNLVDFRREVGEGTYSMHRSVQRFVVGELSGEERQHAFDECVKLLCSRLSRPSTIMVPHLTGFLLFAKYIPHVLSIHKFFVSYRHQLVPTVSFAEMICSVVAYLYEKGLAESCVDLATTGEAVCEQLDKSVLKETKEDPLSKTWASPIVFNNAYKPGTYNLRTLAGNISAYGAGVILCTGGLINRHKGHAMTWKILKFREECIKVSTRDQHCHDYENLLSNGLNDCAEQLINEGRYSEAKAFSERSLDMKCRLLGKDKDQFQFFISKILLAVVALSEGNVQQATRTAQEAITHVEREKGRDDPFTNNYMFHVANVWSAVGEHRKALELLKASLKARRDLFGGANHETLNAHSSVALCLYRLEEYIEASEYIEWCLERAKIARWGREHVLRARYVHSLIMPHIGQEGGQNEADWSIKGRNALEERDQLLREYAKGRWAKPTLGVDAMVYFDYLVNFHAGRTSAIQLD
ncbi:Transcriptional xre family [Fusarium albosuccineum]|uniref:Transcriptional xre family n=1 Tax=Fusarium albosuccineum TaxID=1237068 RepID=A0A8H4L107_9HYPO|nr:Transcriptional xre family [Fusarium albosuccineum]